MVNKKSNVKPKKNRPRTGQKNSISKLRIASTIIVALTFASGLHFISGIKVNNTSNKQSSTDQTIPEQEKSLNRKQQAFTFYERLKGNAVNIKQPESSSNDTDAKKETVYSIQAGSFKTEQQAEQRLVELTLLGFEPTISASINASGNRWHRVMIGPFTSRREMAAARSQLMTNKFEAMVREQSR